MWSRSWPLEAAWLLSWLPGSRDRARLEAAWEARLARLVLCKAARGDCNVGNGHTPSAQSGLHKWVCNQRRCKKQLDRDEPGDGMTADDRMIVAHASVRILIPQGTAPRCCG